MPPPTPKNPAKAARGPKRRRAVVRVRDVTLRQRLRNLVEQPNAMWGLVVAAIVTILASVLGNWAQSQPLIAVGQVMDSTRTVRVPFTTVDGQETDRQREEARQRTPHIFITDAAALEEIRSSLETLPRAVAGVTDLEQIERDIRVRFGLNAERLAALQPVATDESTLKAWSERVAALDGVLRRRPMLDRATFQNATQEGLSPQIALRSADQLTYVSRSDAINTADAQRFAEEIATIVRVSDFHELPAQVVAHRLTHTPRPTFTPDDAGTIEAQDEAAARVEPVVLTIPVGQKIFDRGDVLDQAQYDLHTRELAEYRAQRTGTLAGSWPVWSRWLALCGMIATIIAMLAAYIGAFSPNIWRHAPRVTWLALLICLALLLAAVGTVSEPRYAVHVTLVPIILVAALVTIAYDRRVSLAVGGAISLLVALMLDQSIASAAVSLIGVGLAAVLLAELRDRRTLVRMALLSGAALFVAAVLAGIIRRPITDTNAVIAWKQTLGDGLQGALAGVIVGGITLFVLPIVERLFHITTGMTLVELRDPKQPLLREMQQRAPGTYNHSLNVANIAETAAQAINADSLLTYVGCLYHDIGKINKPEYFVENQGGGPNRHDKLSPAMSLLVIVGHVKDGLEMAREHALPRALQHFIEAHHGTTLVEYFYHRARKQAMGEDPENGAEPEREPDNLPAEIDYRYPGPRPQSKEVAITMLADAVESATRSLSEPTASRIDALVRKLANQRLMDGQFDECDLTLGDLHTICDSISKSVASIYHGRVRYASTDDRKPSEKTETKNDSNDDNNAQGPSEKTA